jgi:hypothetical protein
MTFVKNTSKQKLSTIYLHFELGYFLAQFGDVLRVFGVMNASQHGIFSHLPTK